MKKAIVILFMAVLSVAAFGQSRTWYDTLDLTEISGTDTIIWFADSLNNSMYGAVWSITFRYDSLDDDDATLELGGDNWGVGWNRFIHDSIPFTLHVTNNTVPVNGTNRVTGAIYSEYWPFFTFGIKVNPGSVTTGSVLWRMVIRR